MSQIYRLIFEVTFAAGTVLDLAGNDLGALDTSASWLLGTLQHNQPYYTVIFEPCQSWCCIEPG